MMPLLKCEMAPKAGAIRPFSSYRVKETNSSRQEKYIRWCDAKVQKSKIDQWEVNTHPSQTIKK